MPSNLPQFTIRIDPLMLQKIRYIAEYNARSANKEIEFLVTQHIANFEKEHGVITSDDLNSRL